MKKRSYQQMLDEKALVEMKWFWALVVLVLILTCGGAYSFHADRVAKEQEQIAAAAKAKAAASEAKPKSSPFQMPTVSEMTEWHRAHDPMRERIIRVAEAVAKGDPEAERLAALFKDRTFTSRILPGGLTQAIWDWGTTSTKEIVEKMNNSTELVLATRAEMGFFPHPPKSAFMFARGGFQFVDVYQYSDWYLGVLALHEMVHWDDLVLSQREAHDAPMFSDAWTDGELRAHTLENRILDRITLNGFTNTLRRVLESDQLSGTAPGTPYRVPNQAGMDTIMREAFGDFPKSQSEFRMRGGSATIACLMLQVGDSGPRARAAYNWLLQSQH